jgi:hypothetical protein
MPYWAAAITRRKHRPGPRLRLRIAARGHHGDIGATKPPTGRRSSGLDRAPDASRAGRDRPAQRSPEHLLKLGEITEPVAPHPNSNRHQPTRPLRRRIERAPSRDGAQIVWSGRQDAKIGSPQKARGHRSG